MSEQDKLAQILEVGIEAARAAGARAMADFVSRKCWKKAETEFVTTADAACQQIIIDRIKKTYPGHGFIAEEGDSGKLFRQSPSGPDKVWWVIDPIDGTNNYVHGILNFVVSIAAMQNGEPVAGVIFDPATNSLFSAVKGGRAELNGLPIEVGSEDLNKLVSVGIDSHYDDGVPAGIKEIMRTTRFRNTGATAQHFAYVARGGFVGCITPIAKLWDIAAGILIAQAAGAIVSDWEGSPIFPVDLDSYNGGPFKVVAANPKAYPRLLELANQTGF